jgi:hypothetical protein
MLDAALADALTSTAAETPPRSALYQIVQETALGPRYLTAFDDMDAAMRQARYLNEQTGNAFKTVMWGTGKPIVRVDPRKLRFRGDNILPSLVLHPAAVKGRSDAVPVSAVYRGGSEVVFGADGSATPTHLDGFTVDGVPGFEGPFAKATALAKRAAKKLNKPIFVRTKKRRAPLARATPSSGVNGLGDYQTGVVISPVSPDEFEELVKMAEGAER